MRRTVYILLFCLFMGYLACFSSFTHNVLAAPQVIKMNNVISSSEMQVHNQYAHKERIGVLKQQLDKTSHLSDNRVRKASQSNFLCNAHASDASSQQKFGFPWPFIRPFDISSLWKQQRDKQKKNDRYDLGE